MRARFEARKIPVQPVTRARIMLIIGMLLVIFTIIYVTKDATSTPNPHPRPTARGQ